MAKGRADTSGLCWPSGRRRPGWTCRPSSGWRAERDGQGAPAGGYGLEAAPPAGGRRPTPRAPARPARTPAPRWRQPAEGLAREHDRRPGRARGRVQRDELGAAPGGAEEHEDPGAVRADRHGGRGVLPVGTEGRGGRHRQGQRLQREQAPARGRAGHDSRVPLARARRPLDGVEPAAGRPGAGAATRRSGAPASSARPSTAPVAGSSASTSPWPAGRPGRGPHHSPTWTSGPSGPSLAATAVSAAPGGQGANSRVGGAAVGGPARSKTCSRQAGAAPPARRLSPLRRGPRAWPRPRSAGRRPPGGCGCTSRAPTGPRGARPPAPAEDRRRDEVRQAAAPVGREREDEGPARLGAGSDCGRGGGGHRSHPRQSPQAAGRPRRARKAAGTR